MTQRNAVAILGGVRIPFARHNTAYATTSSLEMLGFTLSALVQRFGLSGERLGEVVAGAVLKHTRDFNLAREATLDSGLAPQTPCCDLQQACATSLQAAIQVGNKIALGQIDSGIAAGVDSASDAPIAVNEKLRQLLLALSRAKTTGERLRLLTRLRPSMLLPATPSVTERRSGLSMGQHCELMVKRWGISRAEQDALALQSHQRAAAAYDAGFYSDLIAPFQGLQRDNNLRADTSAEKLARLAPVFDRSATGTLTAGNSTPLTDGAAAVLLASEQWAQARRLVPQAWLIDAESAAVNYVGDDAEGLLMAPVYAVPRLLARNGLSLQDFDYYEIHEAFAGQVLCTLKAWEDAGYCRKQLGLDGALGSIDPNKLNVNGSSLGLGHPFAATGARIVATAAKQLALHRERGAPVGRTLISVCAAGGLGVSAILQS